MFYFMRFVKLDHLKNNIMTNEPNSTIGITDF